MNFRFCAENRHSFGASFRNVNGGFRLRIPAIGLPGIDIPLRARKRSLTWRAIQHFGQPLTARSRNFGHLGLD
jgi:hypothetical protein